MKKELWLIREELMRLGEKTFTRLDTFLGNYDKKHKASEYKILDLEKRIKKLERK